MLMQNEYEMSVFNMEAADVPLHQVRVHILSYTKPKTQHSKP